MSIQIIDTFKVNISSPIDEKIVVGPNNFYQNKNDIEFKYDGLRIWDLNDNNAWVWHNNIWNLEVVNLNINGTNNFISKFSGSSPNQSLVNSLIFDNGLGVGIGTVSIISGTTLQVNGIIRSSTGGFFGSGANITNINAGNLSSGNLPLARLSGGGVGNILVGNLGAAQWQPISDLFSLNITLNSTNSNQHLLFASGEGNQTLRISNNIRINPNNGNLGLGTNILNNRLNVNGSVSIGTTTLAPTDGLLVQGSVRLNTVSTNNNLSRFLTIDSNNIVSQTIGGLFPIGTIVMWYGSLIPSGWVFCDGSTFNTLNGLVITPDLRERFVVCAGSSPLVPGPGYVVGDIGGLRDVILTSNQIPPHNHDLHGSVHQKNEPSSIGSERLYLFPDGPNGGSNNTITSNIGGGQAHENRPPYFALTFIMYVGQLL